MKKTSLVALACLSSVLALTFLNARERGGVARSIHPAQPAAATDPLENVRPGFSRTTLGPCASKATFYDLDVGEWMHMSLRSQADVEVDFFGRERIEVGFNLESDLRLAVLSSEDEMITLSLSLEAVQIEFPGRPLEGRREANEAFTAMVRGPHLIRISTRGRLLGFLFAKGCSGEVQGLVRGIVFGLVYQLRDAPRWEVAEGDGTTEWQMAYERLEKDGQHLVEKRKLAPLTKDSRSREVVHSEGKVRFHGSITWPEKAHYTETIITQSDEANTRVRQSVSMEFDLIDHGRRDVLLPTNLAAEWSGVLHDATASAEHDAPGAGAHVSHDLPSLLMEFEHAVLSEAHTTVIVALQKQLAALLENDPRKLEEIARQLTSMSSRCASVIFAAIGQMSGPHGQAFLGASMEDAMLPEELRVYAASAACQVHDPAPGLLETLQRLYREERDSGLGSTSLLVLGALSGRTKDSSLLDGLLALGSSLETSEEVSLWLEALGNSRASSILPILESVLADPSPKVRRSAVSALRHLQDPASLRLTAEVALEDPSTAVRSRAAEILGSRKDDISRSALEHLFLTEPDATVRRRALEGLQRAQPWDEARHSLLVRVAAADLSPEVRRLAVALLQG